MTDRNWEAELAKIDKQLASVSDAKLLSDSKPVPATKGPAQAALAAPKSAAAPPRAAASTPTASSTGTWRGWVQVTIAVAAAVGLMFWPWPTRCGPPLLGFTAATGAVALLGVWSAIGTWRHRLGVAHVASLLVIVWGMALGAREILPRVGYATPSADRTPGWSCDALPLSPAVVAPSPR